MDTPILVGLKKPPNLGTYDGTGDPNDHLKNIDAFINYRDISGTATWRLFPTTLRKGGITWYKSLTEEFITS